MKTLFTLESKIQGFLVGLFLVVIIICLKDNLYNYFLFHRHFPVSHQCYKIFLSRLQQYKLAQSLYDTLNFCRGKFINFHFIS